jgi:hypothetical protein
VPVGNFHESTKKEFLTMAKTRTTPGDEATATATAPDESTAATDAAAAKVRAAVSAYNPTTDPRVWRRLSEIWRTTAHEMAEVAAGLQSDGRSAEIVPRLLSMLKTRQGQEPGEISSAVDEFRRTAADFFEAHVSDTMAAEVLQQIEAHERGKAEARERRAAEEQERREQRAAELEAEAARLRQGPPRPASFIAVPSA